VNASQQIMHSSSSCLIFFWANFGDKISDKPSIPSGVPVATILVGRLGEREEGRGKREQREQGAGSREQGEQGAGSREQGAREKK
jgi:hypothetical protein